MKLLRYSQDARSLAFLAVSLGLTAVQWSGLANHWTLVLGSCAFAFIACVINHNHQHHPTFTAPSANRLFGVLLSYATGQPACAIIPMHNRNHHQHNNQREDHVRTSLVRFRWNLLNLLVFPIVAVREFASAKREHLRRWQEDEPENYRQLRWERWLFYPGLIALLIAGPLETVLYLGVPYLAGQWGILAINLVQHDGCDPNSQYEHSRDFTSRLLNWWLLNNGYHCAHHIAPNAHWSQLPRIHAKLESKLDPRQQCPSLFGELSRRYVWPGQRACQVKTDWQKTTDWQETRS